MFQTGPIFHGGLSRSSQHNTIAQHRATLFQLLRCSISIGLIPNYLATLLSISSSSADHALFSLYTRGLVFFWFQRSLCSMCSFSDARAVLLQNVCRRSVSLCIFENGAKRDASPTWVFATAKTETQALAWASVSMRFSRFPPPKLPTSVPSPKCETLH